MTNSELMIEVSIPEQRLWLYNSKNIVLDVAVSTAKNGPGEVAGSECTPCGAHYIRAKIGDGCEPGTVFVGRRPTGEIYTPQLRETFLKRDWILTRILWLSGLEIGKNRLGEVDTMRRYIYIHGCPDEDVMGIPSSHGCVKMRNRDVIELFERVRVGTHVIINN